MSAILPTLYLISHPHRNHPYPPSSVVSSSSRFFSHPAHRFTLSSSLPNFHLPARFLSAFPAASKALDYLPLISARVAHLLPRLSRLLRDRDHHLLASFLFPFFFFLHFSSLCPPVRSFLRHSRLHPPIFPSTSLVVRLFLPFLRHATVLVTLNAAYCRRWTRIYRDEVE